MVYDFSYYDEKAMSSYREERINREVQVLNGKTVKNIVLINILDGAGRLLVKAGNHLQKIA